MASAERTTVTKEVVKAEEVPVVKVEFTEHEASLIHALLGDVAGGPKTHQPALLGIRNALRKAGVSGWWYEYYTRGPNGSTTCMVVDNNC